MSGIMLLLSVSICLLCGSGGSSVTLWGTLERGSVSLNEMFREVEELMEDTQHILEEAVDQITTESAKSSSLNLQSNYHNETKRMMEHGQEAVQVFDKTDKETNNQTGEVRLSHIHMEVAGQWNSMDHGGAVLADTKNWKRPKHGWKVLLLEGAVCYTQCMVDEDCGDLNYCSYEIERSKCLPCIPTDMPCTKDEECCSEEMCVWGQCTVNVTRGTEGTICQGQSDCRPDLCCAFQPELLFPVCNPKPGKGEHCRNHPNLLMDMLAWDQEGPRDHCPCADDIPCQPHGRGSVCGE